MWVGGLDLTNDRYHANNAQTHNTHPNQKHKFHENQRYQEHYNHSEKIPSITKNGTKLYQLNVLFDSGVTNINLVSDHLVKKI